MAIVTYDECINYHTKRQSRTIVHNHKSTLAIISHQHIGIISIMIIMMMITTIVMTLVIIMIMMMITTIVMTLVIIMMMMMMMMYLQKNKKLINS